MYWYNISFVFLLVLISYHVQGQDSVNSTITSATTQVGANASNITLCPDGRNTSQDPTCLTMKNDFKPTRNTGRRVTLILLACLLTVVLVVSLLAVYRRLNQPLRNSSATSPRNLPDSSNPNARNRLNNIFRSIGLNNLNPFLSRSNNTANPSGQRHQTAALNDNPDEALLFDDPYADGGLTSSSANPYKSLTLAVT